MALTTWAAYQAANPDKAKQLTQILMCAKGVGVNDNYVFEIDPVTGGLPIIISPTTIQYDLDAVSTKVAEDTVVPANNRPLPVKVFSTTGVTRTKANAPVRHAYSTNVTTLAYTQLVAATTLVATKMQIFDSSGQTLYLGFGAAGAEVDQLMIVPGGLDIEYTVPASTRISIKAISADATAGEIVINFLT